MLLRKEAERREFAVRIFQGLCSMPDDDNCWNTADAIAGAVKWAAALQAELDRTVPKCEHKNKRDEYIEEFPYGGQSHFTKMGTRCLDCGAEV